MSTPTNPTRYESTAQPGLFFWADRVPGPVECYTITQQVTGYPATEACDDWPANFADADEMARGMAAGTLEPTV